MKKARRYPGEEEAEKQKRTGYTPDFIPDMIDYATPNYEKFERMGWTAEKTLAWLNID